MVYINNEQADWLPMMNEAITSEQEILGGAVLAFEQEAGLHLRIERRESMSGRLPVDAIVMLEPGERVLTVEVKKWAQHGNLGALINRVRQLPGEGLLVADYINPRMAETLRRQNVQFIDVAGNAFINQPPVYVYVTGRRQPARDSMPRQDGAKRAFEAVGLKVVYALLCHPPLANRPYREIAEKAGVALGTVGSVLNGLKAGGLVHDKGRGQGRRLTHYQKLLDRWVDVYPEKLRPKQWVGGFVGDDPYWWEAVDIQAYDGYWSGEIAASRYTGDLKPQVVTVYLPERERTRFLGDARLRKMSAGTDERSASVLVYRPFWPDLLDELGGPPRRGLVHPVLAYADLVATGDPRNLEAARSIYEEYIAQYCSQD